MLRQVYARGRFSVCDSSTAPRLLPIIDTMQSGRTNPPIDCFSAALRALISRHLKTSNTGNPDVLTYATEALDAGCWPRVLDCLRICEVPVSDVLNLPGVTAGRGEDPRLPKQWTIDGVVREMMFLPRKITFVGGSGLLIAYVDDIGDIGTHREWVVGQITNFNDSHGVVVFTLKQISPAKGVYQLRGTAIPPGGDMPARLVFSWDFKSVSKAIDTFEHMANWNGEVFQYYQGVLLNNEPVCVVPAVNMSRALKLAWSVARERISSLKKADIIARPASAEECRAIGIPSHEVSISRMHALHPEAVKRITALLSSLIPHEGTNPELVNEPVERLVEFFTNIPAVSCMSELEFLALCEAGCTNYAFDDVLLWKVWRRISAT